MSLAEQFEAYAKADADERYETTGLIYFTHMLVLCAMFAIFLLSASRAYARTKETGHVSVLSTNAARRKARGN